MQLTKKLQRAVVSLAIDRTLRYINKNPKENLVKLICKAQRLAGGVFPKGVFDSFRDAVTDRENTWSRFAGNMLSDIDHTVLKKMLLALGLGSYNGTKAVRANREKYKCNIPYIILLDPTSACNLKCKGCWASEYGNRSSLTYDEMESIVSQGVELGAHLYMFTGGEPLIRKDDILRLCAAHPECAFLAYTNSTLIDDDFCVRMNEAGNLSLALSIEGNKETNDSRRGNGSYDKTIKAMRLLKSHKCLFGISICYTRVNLPVVTSDDFLDKMLAEGVKFALCFNYMPVGHDADVDLIPTPEQRRELYSRLRVLRSGKGGKPMFIMDFQNDGEYVGGCIAGGRNYFHINSAGDIEPCVFVHYSDSNIRTDTLLEALRKPLFTAFWHNQPFNDNHLRPCPFFENPECLVRMVNETGAKSTDLISPEPVEALYERCSGYAEKWSPIADEIWKSSKHPNPKTQFYRDTPEGREKLEQDAPEKKKAECPHLPKGHI